MRKIKNTLLFVFLLSVLLSFSCKAGINEDYKTLSDKKTAYLSLSLEDDSRTVLPETKVFLAELKNFKVYSSITSDVIKDRNIIYECDSYIKLRDATIKMTEGEFYIGISADYNGSEFAGITSAVFVKDKITTVSLSLELVDLGVGEGNVSINLIYTGNEAYQDASFVLENIDTLKTVNGSVGEKTYDENTNKTSVHFFAEKVPAGFYKIKINAFIDDNKYAGYTDVVKVATGLVSEGEYECSEFLSYGVAKKVKITYRDSKTVLKVSDEYAGNPIKLTQVDSTKIIDYWTNADGEKVYYVPEEDIVLYATYANVCKISFEDESYTKTLDPILIKEGSSVYVNTKENVSEIYCNNKVITINNPVKDGFYVVGWSIEENGVIYDLYNPLIVEEDTVLIPVWKKLLQISFDDESGVDFEPVYVRAGYYYQFHKYDNYSLDLVIGRDYQLKDVVYSKTIIIPKREGYSVNNISGVELKEKTIIRNDITITVEWKQIQVSGRLIFNTNGGTEIISYVDVGEDQYVYIRDDTLYVGEEEYDIATEKEGLAFAGWYEDEECTIKSELEKEYGPSKLISGSVTLYAKWVPGVNVIFNFSDDIKYTKQLPSSAKLQLGSTKYFSFVYLNRTTHFEVEFPVIEGKVFNGWYFDSEYKQPLTYGNYTVTEELQLYAKYDEAVKVTIDIPGRETESLYVLRNTKCYTSTREDPDYGNITELNDGNYNSLITIETPLMEGYYFDGFQIQGTGEKISTNYKEAKLIQNDIVLTPIFKKGITVNFIVNNVVELSLIVPENRAYYIYKDHGSIYFETYDFSKIININLPENVYIEDWYLDKYFETRFASDRDSAIELTKNTDIYVKTQRGLKISFDSNGGSEVEPLYIKSNINFYITDTQYLYIRDDILIDDHDYYRNTPKKEGYIFAGWYLDKELQTPVPEDNSSSIFVSEDFTLYAKYESASSISYVDTDGTIKHLADYLSGSTIRFSIWSTRCDFSVSKNNFRSWFELEIPEKEGYLFDGWYLDSELTRLLQKNVEEDIYGDIILYPKFTKGILVTFVDTNKKITLSPNASVYMYMSSGNSTLYYKNLNDEYYSNIEVTIPKKSKKFFGGFYLDAELTNPLSKNSESPSIMKEDTYVYEKWYDEVLIEFDPECGMEPISYAKDSVLFNQGHNYYLPDNEEESYYHYIQSPVKTGYKFAGWYLDSNLEEKFMDDENYVLSENITLYPKWEKKIKVIIEGNNLVQNMYFSENARLYFSYGDYRGAIVSPGLYYEDENLNFTNINGYIFEGLYFDKEYTQPFPTSSGDAFLLQSELKLYRKYIEAVDVNIIFEYMNRTCKVGKNCKFYFANEGFYSNYLVTIDSDTSKVLSKESFYSNYRLENLYFDSEYTQVVPTDAEHAVLITESIDLYPKYLTE